MWLLTWLPAALLIWIVNLILTVGIIGTAITYFSELFLKYMPWLTPHKMIVQIISLVLLVAGVYFKGGVAVEMEWRAKVKEAELKVAQAEDKANEANLKLEEEREKKNKVITQTKVVIQERIVEREAQLNENCVVPPEAISILNDAAKKPEEEK